jgi:hypothetical protein
VVLRSTVADRDTRKGLLEPDGITAANLAALQDRGVDPHISSVVLGRCARIPALEDRSEGV